MSYITDNCDVPMIPISGHITPWSVDGWVVESKFIQGGYIVVADINERNKLDDKSIYEERSALVHGTPVYVSSEKKTYRWDAFRETWDEDALDADAILSEIDRLKETAATNTFVTASVESAKEELRAEMPDQVSDLQDAAQYAKIVEVERLVDASVGTVENTLETKYYKKIETFDRNTIDGKIAAVSTESIQYTDKEINKLKNEYPSKNYVATYVDTVVDTKLASSGVIKQDYLIGNYYDKLQVDTLLVGKASTQALSDVSAKFNSYYTKAQVDNLIANVTVDLSDYYTKYEIDNRLENLDINLSDYYTKDEVDARLRSIDLSDYAKKSDIPDTSNFITRNVNNLTNYYTKAQSDAIDYFGDVVTSVAIGSLAAGTSLKGMSVKEVLEMALRTQAPAEPAVDFIMKNNVPAYTGTEGSEVTALPYVQLDSATASYTDQGFYVSKNGTAVEKAGYQLSFEGNTEMKAQQFAIPSNAKVINSYQYQPAMSAWLDQGFDGTYWIKTGEMTNTVNGKAVTYSIYSYNVDEMGDAMTATEYWRFELEV